MYSIIANTHPFLEVANLNELIHTSTVEDMKSLSRDSIASYKVGYLALSYCGDLEDEMTLKAVAHAAITGKILTCSNIRFEPHFPFCVVRKK